MLPGRTDDWLVSARCRQIGGPPVSRHLIQVSSSRGYAMAVVVGPTPDPQTGDVSPFARSFTVRSYELNSVGHVSHHQYHLYSESARLDLFAEANVPLERVLAAGINPALLSTTATFRRELRAREVIVVTCEPTFGSGKSFAMDSVIRLEDGTLVSEIACTMGLVDASAGRLLTDPLQQLVDLGGDRIVLSGPTGKS